MHRCPLNKRLNEGGRLATDMLSTDLLVWHRRKSTNAGDGIKKELELRSIREHYDL